MEIGLAVFSGVSYEKQIECLKKVDVNRIFIDAEHPEFDNRPDSQIPEGMSVDEFSEAMGASINEFGEIIRPAGQDSAKSDIPPELLAWLNEDSTPLKKREEQLVALEKEAKTISEAEALISKQSQKTGEQK